MPFTLGSNGWLSLDDVAAPFISISHDSLLTVFVFFCVREKDCSLFRTINEGKKCG